MTPPPFLSKPENGDSITDQTPYFNWSTTEFAVRYELIVDDSSSFGSPEIHDSNIIGSDHNSPVSLDSDTYYWRVRGANSAGDWGDWSDTWTFTIGQDPPQSPELYEPDNGQSVTDQTPYFDWSRPSSAVRYDLVVDNSSSFSSPVIRDSNIDRSYYTPSNPLPFDTYY